MKQFLYSLLILALIYVVYWYLTKPPDIIRANGTLRILEENSSGNFYNASIQGTAENTGDITVTNVWIAYEIGDEEVSAFINQIEPKQKISFRTGTCQTKIKKPFFKLVSIKFNH